MDIASCIDRMSRQTMVYSIEFQDMLLNLQLNAAI